MSLVFESEPGYPFRALLPVIFALASGSAGAIVVAAVNLFVCAAGTQQ